MKHSHIVLLVLALLLAAVFTASCNGNNAPKPDEPTPDGPQETLSGSAGLTYAVNDDGETCAVTGIGTCTDTEVIIPSVCPDGHRVTAIDSGAFADCATITRVTIPDGVMSIGKGAFSMCTSLSDISIPDSVTRIDLYAFLNCSDLTYTTYDHANYLGNAQNPYVVLVQAENTDLTACTVHPGAKIIYVGAFYNCMSLSAVTIPVGVTSVGQEAFGNCASLTEVILPDGVRYIGGNAFYGCEALTSISIPDSVTEVDVTPFSYCSSLVYTLYENARYLGNAQNPYVFLVQPTDTSTATCTIHPDTKIIGYGAFNGSSVTTVTIPRNVVQIGDFSFLSCADLSEIRVAAGNPRYRSDGNCLIETTSKTLIVGCKNTVIPSDGSVETIGFRAFYQCTSLSGITIPDSVRFIGGSAFGACSSLESITIPGSVRTIDRYAFSDCTSLKSVTIGSGTTSIGDSAFAGCTALAGITIPDSVTIIDTFSFQKCRHLRDIVFSGTKAQWEAITREYGWNESTGDYTVHCTDGDLAKDDT